MPDFVNGKAAESLARALADLASVTSEGGASARVKRELRDKVHAIARRRRAMGWMAAAAALAAVLLAIPWQLHRQPARGGTRPAVATARTTPGAGAGTTAAPAARIETAIQPRAARTQGATKKPRGARQWRTGEVVLSPWYYNTAVAPASRGILVRSEVDAATARHFGVVVPGATAPVEILFGDDGLPRALRFVQRVRIQRD